MKSIDSVLKQLADLARQQQAPQRPADAVEARRLEELTGPPSPEAEERVVGRILGGHDSGDPLRKPGKLARTSRRFWLGLIAPVALAAAAWLLWMKGTGPTAPLPPYGLTASGGVSEYRSGETAAEKPLVLEAGATLEVVLRPSTAAAGPVAVRLYWTEGAQEQPWQVAPEMAPGGSIRIRGAVARPFGPGAGELVGVVGRPGDLPDRLADALARPTKLQVLRRPVVWR